MDPNSIDVHLYRFVCPFLKVLYHVLFLENFLMDSDVFDHIQELFFWPQLLYSYFFSPKSAFVFFFLKISCF